MQQEAVVPHTVKSRYLIALALLRAGKKLSKSLAEAYLLQLMTWSEKGHRDPVIGFVETEIDPTNPKHVIYEWMHTSARTAAFIAKAAEAAGGRVVERVTPITVSISPDGSEVAYRPFEGYTVRNVYKVVIAW